ncbi:MAG: hypothetical protein AB7I34_09175 [Rhizobiaceae bacterium]
MRPDFRKPAKLDRVVRYGAFAVFAAWSLMAIVLYAAAGWLGEFTAGLTGLDGWLAYAGKLIDSAAGSIVAVIWLLGSLAILGLSALARRLTS